MFPQVQPSHLPLSFSRHLQVATALHAVSQGRYSSSFYIFTGSYSPPFSILPLSFPRYPHVGTYRPASKESEAVGCVGELYEPRQTGYQGHCVFTFPNHSNEYLCFFVACDKQGGVLRQMKREERDGGGKKDEVWRNKEEEMRRQW